MKYSIVSGRGKQFESILCEIVIARLSCLSTFLECLPYVLQSHSTVRNSIFI